MVRINLINPKNLADQHLVAEYNEILMLFGYVRKYPSEKSIPHKYCLGKGHVTFFKNKLKYLKERHEVIRKEMQRRNFATNVSLSLEDFPKNLQKAWKPEREDFDTIKQRLITKINLKPSYYRYEGKKREKKFFLNLIQESS